MKAMAVVMMLIVALGAWTHLAPVHLGTVMMPMRPLLYLVFFGVSCVMAWRLLRMCGA